MKAPPRGHPKKRISLCSLHQTTLIYLVTDDSRSVRGVGAAACERNTIAETDSEKWHCVAIPASLESPNVIPSEMPSVLCDPAVNVPC